MVKKEVTFKRQVHKILEGNKLFFLGIATLCIILYHMPRVFPFLKIFNPGFIGVDFFLFFSGFSLCYSIEKNSLGEYFKRRFLRIYPMYFILATSTTLIPMLFGEEYSLWDYLCNITTLSYYKIGGSFVDWYLSSLLYFYLLFPLLYSLILRFKWTVPVLFSLIVCGLVSIFDIDWWYGCAVGRLPIFSLGLFLFLDKSENKRHFILCSFFYFVVFAISVYLYKTGTFMRGYFMTDMITPLILLMLAYVLHNAPNLYIGRGGSVLSAIGSYSLEIYVANVITMKTVGIIWHDSNGWMTLVAYFVINVIYAIALILVNSVVKKYSYSRD